MLRKDLCSTLVCTHTSSAIILKYFFLVDAYINIPYKRSLIHTHYVQPLFLSISSVKCMKLPGGMLDSCPKPLAFLSLCICVCRTELAFCGFLWACSIFEPVCVCGLGHVTACHWMWSVCVACRPQLFLSNSSCN